MLDAFEAVLDAFCPLMPEIPPMPANPLFLVPPLRPPVVLVPRPKPKPFDLSNKYDPKSYLFSSSMFMRLSLSAFSASSLALSFLVSSILDFSYASNSTLLAFFR
jgi:hypothetical protein